MIKERSIEPDGQQPTISEKRKYIRLTPSKPIAIKFSVVDKNYVGEDAKYQKALSKNVSGGGMFIELPISDAGVLEKLLDGDQLLLLDINIPTVEHPIKALARITWIEGKKELKSNIYGVGVSFESINETDRDKIIDYIIDSYLGEEEEE